MSSLSTEPLGWLGVVPSPFENRANFPSHPPRNAGLFLNLLVECGREADRGFPVPMEYLRFFSRWDWSRPGLSVLRNIRPDSPLVRVSQLETKSFTDSPYPLTQFPHVLPPFPKAFLSAHPLHDYLFPSEASRNFFSRVLRH